MDTVLSLNAVPVILPPLSEMILVCDKQLTGNTLKLLGRIYLPKNLFVPTIALWFLRKRTNSYYVLSITVAIVLGIP